MNNLKVINLSGYEVPTVKESTRYKWVEYGDNNNYFGELIERYLGSPTNSRCVNGITDLIYGRGLDATDSSENAVQFGQMEAILRNEDVRKIVSDLKLLGQASIQVVYNKTKTKIMQLKHFPSETLRAEKAKDGKIEAYYYHPNWGKIKPNDKPKRIPSFKCGKKSEKVEIYCVKPYRAGFYYYSPVDYQGCLQYCSLEEEVSNYHISNIQNGLQPSLLLNFNNGIPGDEAQDLIERKIYDKFSGSSNAGKFILCFNEDSEAQSTVEPIHLPDAHAQYEFLAKESREKIMIGHGVVSPILLGIKDNIATKIKREEETGEKLSSEEKNDFNDEEGDDLMSQLEGLGEKIDENDWELIHTEKVEDTESEFDFTKLAQVSESDAKPNRESSQDNSTYKVRYSYGPVRNSANSRKFCRKMEALTTQNLVFRKEDINMMSFRGVNRKLGHKGENYSLLKFKGGVNCHHYWELKVYKKKVSEKNLIDESEAIADGLKEPNNPPEMSIEPRNMPNSGHHPNYKK